MSLILLYGCSCLASFVLALFAAGRARALGKPWGAETWMEDDLPEDLVVFFATILWPLWLFLWPLCFFFKISGSVRRLGIRSGKNKIIKYQHNKEV